MQWGKANKAFAFIYILILMDSEAVKPTLLSAGERRASFVVKFIVSRDLSIKWSLPKLPKLKYF